MQRHDVSFDSQGERCAAWLFRPETAGGRLPAVVLAHGWGALRDFRGDAFAERFAAAGFVSLVFDYRHFGASGGEPRELLSIPGQRADIAAALAYVRGLDDVDPGRVALWGTSFGGGHALATAAADARLAAALALVPFVDGLRNALRLDPLHSLRLTREGLIDQVGSWLGRAPHYVTNVGRPGSLAVMNAPGSEAGMASIVPEGAPFSNRTAARILLATSGYRPGRQAGRIRCPLHVIVGDDDRITPPDLAIEAARRAPRAEVLNRPGNHFAFYTGDGFEWAVAEQLAFLERTLMPAAAAAAA